MTDLSARLRTHGLTLSDFRTLKAITGTRFTDAEIHEAALEMIGGPMTAAEAIQKVARRAALEAVRT